jgi:KUP system potassium uptake protein
VLAVVLFRSSSNLAAAYGIAVTLDMLITTVLTFFVLRYGWGYPLARCAWRPPGSSSSIDFAFFGLQLAQAVRRRLVPAAHRRRRVHADDHLETRPRAACIEVLRAMPSTCRASSDPCSSSPPARVPGTAVFLTADPGTVPERAAAQPQAQQGAARAQPVRHRAQPRGALDRRWTERLEVESPGPRLLAGASSHYGFKNDPDRAARRLQQLEGRGLRASTP